MKKVIVDTFDLDERGNILVAKHMYPVLESVFGKQPVIAELENAYVLSSISTSRFFRIVLLRDSIVETVNVIDKGDYLVVDVPDFYESADKMVVPIVEELVALLKSSLPITVERFTVVKRVVPEGRVKCNGFTVTRGVVDDVLWCEKKGSYLVEGYAVLRIRAKL